MSTLISPHGGNELKPLIHLQAERSDEFKRAGNKNKLTPDNQQNILGALEDRVDVDHFVKLVPNEDIAANDYNIAVSSYIEAEDTREIVDITELNAEIGRIVSRQVELRASIDRIVADLEGSA